MNFNNPLSLHRPGTLRPPCLTDPRVPRPQDRYGAERCSAQEGTGGGTVERSANTPMISKGLGCSTGCSTACEKAPLVERSTGAPRLNRHALRFPAPVMEAPDTNEALTEDLSKFNRGGADVLSATFHIGEFIGQLPFTCNGSKSSSPTPLEESSKESSEESSKAAQTLTSCPTLLPLKQESSGGGEFPSPQQLSYPTLPRFLESGRRRA